MEVKDWLGEDNKIGQDIWEKKYQKNNETFDDWLDRVSNGDKELRQLIVEKKFLFGGRILSNRGLEKEGKKITLSNCYVLPRVDDSIESIFQCASDMARTFSYGGGVGVDLSNLSPRGATINNAAKTTTGSVSFMDLYSLVSELIGSEGRRAALMLSLSCDHPDLLEFIELKSDLDKVTKANISVRITDKFMEAVKTNSNYELVFHRKESNETIVKTVNARDVMYRLAEMNWEMGEPGVLFWDSVLKYNLLNEYGDFEYASVNPCLTGDMKLLTSEGYKTFEELCDTEFDIINSEHNTTKGKVWCSGTKETIKLTMRNGNVIKCTPDHVFMTDVLTECKAKDMLGKQFLFHSVTKETIKHVDAGIVDKIENNGLQKVYDFTEPGTHWGVVNGVIAHNCGEEPLPEGGSCLLGSLNLSEFVKNKMFDFDDLRKATAISVIGLNDVLDEGLPLHPLKMQRDSVDDYRQIGLGIMGLADMLIKMGIKYGSHESIELCDKIGDVIAQESLATSARLAKKKGVFKKYNKKNILNSSFYKAHPVHEVKKNGLRNSQLLTCAPTGTISTLLNISGGIEPIYDTSYTRKTEALHEEEKYYKIYTPIVKKFMEENNISDEAYLPDYFVTSKTLDYNNRIEMQKIWQKHIDASISSTVNLPESATIEDVFDIYVKAHEAGLKGITVFRDNCKRVGILTKDGEQVEQHQFDYIEPPTKEEIGETIGFNDKKKVACGSLYLTVGKDPKTQNIVEMYINKSKSGVCEAMAQGISRMVSTCLRSGVSVEYLCDQLINIKCPACTTAIREGKKVEKSCPHAIGSYILEKYQQGITVTDLKQVDKPPKRYINSDNICPDCGEELAASGGCVVCSCGYSKCG